MNDHGQGHDSFTPIVIDKRPYKAPAPEMTGAELKAMAGITGNYDLWFDAPGPDDDRLQDDKPFRLRQGFHFYSMLRDVNPGR